MKFTIFHDSRIGKRQDNQDRLAYCYSREALLMVVADGMGGHPRGEAAAQIAVRFLTDAFRREALPRLPDPFLFLSWGFTQAHQAIADYAAAERLPEVPRTTCVACVVQDSIAYWAHVGDSRLYVVREGRVLAQTRDHSRVQMMIDQGLLTTEAARRHAARNLVYSCLGGAAPPQVDFSRKTPLYAGDTILLCTDGIWGALDDETLVRLLAGSSTAQAVRRLADEAEARAAGHGDNLSLIAMNWEDNYGADETPVVETRTMPLDTHTTMMLDPGGARASVPALSEEDIDRAIEEIRGAIRKYSP